MATGLPVVCHREGGYAELIEHGVDGFLFGTEPDAERLILTLKQDPALRERIGAAARARIERVLSPEALEKMAKHYAR